MKLTCRVCQDLLPLKVLMPESFLGSPVTACYFPCNISSSYFSNFGFSVIFFQLRLMPLFTNGLHWQQCRNTFNKKYCQHANKYIFNTVFTIFIEIGSWLFLPPCANFYLHKQTKATNK